MSILAPTYLGTTAVVSGSPATLNNPATVGFGTTDPNRWIFACITAGTAARTWTSVTIGGVTATKLVSSAGTAARPSAIYVANVPNNTVQTVVVTMSGSDSMQASLYSTIGNLDTTPIATFLNEGQGNLGTISMATRNGGIWIGVAAGVSNANTFYTGDIDVNDLKNNITGGGQASHKSTLNTGATLTNIITQSTGSIDTACAISMGPINTDATTIATTLSKLTQSLAVTEKMPSTIAQTLKGITQSLSVVLPITGSIAQTLPGFTQTANADTGFLTYLGSSNQNSLAVSTFTFPGWNIGAARSDRWIFVTWAAKNTANLTLNSVTIGGVTATLETPDGTLAPGVGLTGIAFANVPSGTTADVVFDWNGTFTGNASNGMCVSVYTFLGNVNPVATDSFDDDSTTTPYTATLNVPPGGFALISATANNSLGTVSGDFALDNEDTFVTGLNNFSLRAEGGSLNDITYSFTATDFSFVSADTPKIGRAYSLVNIIDQTLPTFTQSIAATELMSNTITQTLPGLVQEIDVQSFAGVIDQTLPTFTQALIAVMEPAAIIDQTLQTFTQALAVGMVRNADISTTLFAPTQEAVATEVFPSTIAQTLPGFTQEIDTTETNNISIDMLVCAIGTHTVPLTPLVYLGQSAISSNSNPVTFHDFLIGSEDPNRWIFACVTSGTSPRTFVGATIGGIPATLLVEADGSGTGRPSAIYAANVPTGGTADIVVTQTGTNNMQLSLFSTTGHVNVVPVDSFTRIVNPTPETVNLNTQEGGVALGIAAGVTVNNTFFGGDFDTLDWKNGNSAGGQGSHRAAITDGSPLGVTVRSVGSIDTACAVSIGPAGGPGTALTQVLDMNAFPVAQIDQTLPGFSQEIDVRSFAGVIVQTLSHLTQAASFHVTFPPGAINADIDQTLPGFSQEIDIHVTTACYIDQTLSGLLLAQSVQVTSTNADIDQTLTGISQEIDIIESMDGVIDQTLTGISQEIDVVEIMVAHIDQTLAGFGQVEQEIDVVSYAGVIDQTLLGFEQEIDVVEEIDCIIDQTLLGFSQDFEGHVEEPAGVIAVFIDQTLPGFTQEIDVSALKIDISVELQGIRQRIDINIPSKSRHVRGPHAVPMPSKDMPIHPGELEFFRGKVYGRAVDAMVPPPLTARSNLTTQRYPNPRVPVNRTPLGKKPS